MPGTPCLTQHLRVRHGGLRNGQSEEDVILSARKLTEGLVAKETLKNLQALLRLRLESDPNCRMYHKMTVSILNVPYEVLNIELYCTEEEEATKLICLYLLHKNKIRPLVERERPVSIGVNRFPFLVAVVVVALVRPLGLKFGTSVDESGEKLFCFTLDLLRFGAPVFGFGTSDPG